MPSNANRRNDNLRWLLISGLLALPMGVAKAQSAEKPLAPSGFPVGGLIQALKDPDTQLAALHWYVAVNGEQDDAIFETIKRLSIYSSVEIRAASAHALSRFGEKGVDLLLKLLDDPEYLPKSSAIDALGMVGSEAGVSISRLIEFLKRPGTRIEAARALGRIGPQAIGPLRSILQQEKDPLIRISAVSALRGMGKDATPAVEDLMYLLQEDKDSNVQQVAIFTLGEIGPGADTAVDVLIPFLNSRNAHAAIDALGRIVTKKSPAIDALLRVLDSPHSEEVATALGRIGKSMGEEAAVLIRSLVKLLQDENSRTNAAEALRMIGKPAVSSLIELLAHEMNQETRRVVIAALGGIGKDAAPAVKLLIHSFHDPDTRKEASNALSRIGLPSVDPLVKLLNNNTDREIIYNIVDTLGKIGKPAASAVGDLERVLTDKIDDETRWATIHALGKVSEPAKAVAMYIGLLAKETNPKNRRWILNALKWMGEEASPAVEPLLRLLENPNERRSAIETLGRIARGMGNKAGSVVDALIKLLNPANFDQTISALESIIQKAGMTTSQRIALLEKFPSRETIPNWLDRAPRDSPCSNPEHVCALLELALLRPSTRSSRLLDTYILADEDVRPLIRRLGGRSTADLPSLETLSHEQQVRHVRGFTTLLLATSKETLRSRNEVAFQLSEVLKSSRWTRVDLPTLHDARNALHQTEQNAEADRYGKQIDEIEQQETAVNYSLLVAVILGGHMFLWIGLILIYPVAGWVRSVFFWNPWIFWLVGLGYVPLILARLPFVRHRLLSPYQPGLVPDRYRNEFNAESYFAASQITTARQGKTVAVSATQHLRPLRGRCVVEGPAGYGKTTLVQWLVHEPDVPCLVLPAIDCDGGVMEAIQGCFPEIPSNHRFLRTLVTNGGVDLIIDGLNETTPETREAIRAFVNDRFRGNYLLTTQPILGYKPPRGAEVWKLQPLTPDDARAFLFAQWARVVEQAKVSREQYEDAVKVLLSRIGPGSETDQFALATPLDAALVADLLAQNIDPNPGDLIAQHVRLARVACTEIAPGQAPRFDAIGERALGIAIGKSPKFDPSGLEPEIAALLKQKLVSQRDGKLYFRHEQIRNYFIALSIRGVEDALPLREDARLTGVFEFLPKTMNELDADDLGVTLIADWSYKKHGLAEVVLVRYRLNWEEPGPAERTEMLRNREALKAKQQVNVAGGFPNDGGEDNSPTRKDLVEQFCVAVQEAFILDDLQMLVATRLGTRLDIVVFVHRPFGVVVFDLVQWAKLNGRLRALAEAISAARPSRQDVRDAASAILRLEPEVMVV